MKIELQWNGQSREFEVAPSTLLSELLGDEGPAALLDGKLVDTRLMLSAQAHQRALCTVSGLSGEWHRDFLSPALRQSASPAQLLAAYALLQEESSPTPQQLEEVFQDLLCDHPSRSSEWVPAALSSRS